MSDKAPSPPPNPLADAESVRALGEGLKSLANSIREFPGQVVVQVQAVEQAFQVGAMTGGMAGVIAGLILAAVWRRLRRDT